MLRLHSSDGNVLEVCAICGGKGWVPAPTTYSVRTKNHIGPFLSPSSGKPVPCSGCHGSKMTEINPAG